MQIDRLVLGAYETNCYVVRKDEKTSDCLIIDTGLSNEALIDFLKDKNFVPRVLILTHGHADHIAGVDILREHFDKIKVCIHRDDSHMLSNPDSNLSFLTGMKITAKPAEIIFDEEKEVELINLKFQVIHTPGHTPGGICLYNSEEKILFSGDTLFAGSVGRTDFPGYDMQKCFDQLISSIKEKLLPLPNDITVLSGHGEATTMELEKQYNPFLH
ncbi:MAG: MBL fold metallo-hydrolase [Sedimentisphaerales bacterium]|nr:MBL fold metallo-hydrolase [Sedimentisphaerales bacterium]